MNRLIRKHIIWEYRIIIILLAFSIVCSIGYELIPVLQLTQSRYIIHGNTILTVLIFFWIKKLRKIV